MLKHYCRLDGPALMLMLWALMALMFFLPVIQGRQVLLINISPTLLSSNGIGEVYGIAVNGNDVYMTGFTQQSGKPAIGTYWKNGTPTLLAEGLSTYAITVNGNDVYITGTALFNGKTVPAYWKNNSLVPLGDGAVTSYAYAVTVVGSNVYVAGITHDKNGKINACYWKNGVLNVLPQGVAGKSSAYGIAVVPH